MILIVLLVLVGYFYVADEPVCLNSATSSHVDSRCTADAIEAQRRDAGR
jgi:hypothetical protein